MSIFPFKKLPWPPLLLVAPAVLSPALSGGEIPLRIIQGAAPAARLADEGSGPDTTLWLDSGGADRSGAPNPRWKLVRRHGLKVAVIRMSPLAPVSSSSGAFSGAARPRPAARGLDAVMPRLMRAKPDVIVLALHAGEHTRLDGRGTVHALIWEYPQIDLALCAGALAAPGRAVGDYSWLMQTPPRAGALAVADLVYDPVRRRVTSLRTRIVWTKIPKKHQ